MPFTEQWFENFFESAAAAKDAGLHRAYAHFQHFGDFLVAQTLEVSQDHRAAKDLRNLLQSDLHRYLNLLGCEPIEGSSAEVRDVDLGKTFFGLGVNRDILLQVALEPAAMIERFADRDAVEPSLQGAALSKLADALEGFQENFLSGVGSVSGIAEHAKN